MPGSVRNYAVLYLGGRSSTGGSAVGLGGGNVLASTPTHKLDGVEHLAPDDTERLDATIDRHGLLPKLSGVAAEKLGGTGLFAVPIADELVTLELDTTQVLAPDGAGGVAFRSEAGGTLSLDGLSDVTVTAVTAGDRLRFNGSLWVNSALRWEPHVAYDGTVVLDGNGDPVMVEVA